MSPATASPAKAASAVARVAAMSDRLRRWLQAEALPFWADVGIDRRYGGFVEHLTLEGRPANVDYKRVRVQARQLFVFSQAARSGWMARAAQIARQGGEFLMRNAWDGDRQAWVRTLGADGVPADRTIDLYDNAFCVFALANYYRLGGDPRLLRRMEQTVLGVRKALAHASGRGYRAAEDIKDRSLQNHNMHWFEAMLAAWSVSGRDIFRDEALAIGELFHRHLFDAASGTLAELFDQRWQRVATNGAVIIEPGHHYEWSVLLAQFAALGGKVSKDAVSGLLGFADRAGIAECGLIWDEVTAAGQPHKRSHRLWPQTEAIRAAVVRPMEDEEERARLLEPLVGALLERYLARTPAGTWNEQLDAELKPTADKVPTSSMYHIVAALVELLGRQHDSGLATARR